MDKQTIDAYNKISDEYAYETITFWDELPRNFLNKFIELSGRKILDVGSGPGRDGLLLQQSDKEVVCIDASENMIKLSSKRGLESILASFDNLPFENELFDGIWSYASLLHTPKNSVDIPLNEIYRVLKKYGIFALGLIEGENEGYREGPLNDTSRWFSYYQKDEVIDLCKKHGFELIYFEVFKPRSKNYLNFILRKV